jgi:pimeloyl-ACP methyl ester carboxylesterase
MHLLLWIACSATALIATGFLYQCIGGHRDRKRFTGSGRSLTVGRGCRFYLLEKGSGSPTVLFEAGIAATNLNWFHIQEKVAGFTGTASYDRGGLGWSSPCRTARTPGNIAEELRGLLRCALIQPPYILVGHSFGGLVMRRFAELYSEDVAGVVLVDPMRCEEWPPLNPTRQPAVDLGRRLTRFAILLARFGVIRLAVTSLFRRTGQLSGRLAGTAGVGVRHVLDRIKGEVVKMPEEVWPIIAAHWSRPSYYTGMRNHLVAVPDTVREMQDAEPIRGIPVVVLTPGKSTPLSDEQLNRIGDNVQQVIASASAHWIHLDEPDLVIDSIREIVAVAAAQTAEAAV